MSDSQPLPQAFVSRIQQQLGGEANDLLTALDGDPVLSVRMNAAKATNAFVAAKNIEEASCT